MWNATARHPSQRCSGSCQPCAMRPAGESSIRPGMLTHPPNQVRKRRQRTLRRCSNSLHHSIWRGKTMLDTPTLAIYELSVNVRVSWQAHSLSNAGTEGSNRLMPRRQLLADGSVTDACSGSIAKHHHAVLLAEYLAASGVPLCPACQQRDGRRAAALVERPEYKNISVEQILRNCGLCDAHGFLVTAKNASSQQGTEARERNAKHSLVEFSFALGLPGRSQKTMHLFTRSGDSKEEGQMLMKKPTRSGDYALEVRYRSVGVGVDTDKWQVAIVDEQQ